MIFNSVLNFNEIINIYDQLIMSGLNLYMNLKCLMFQFYVVCDYAVICLTYVYTNES